MAQDNSNSTMEMGTSDQVLVATKSRKTTYLIGFIAMVIAIGVVVTLVVVLSGNEGGVAEPIVSPTPSPTTPVTTPSTATPITPTTAPPDPVTTTTTAPTTVTQEPDPSEPQPLDLDDIINGVFSPPSFNATFTSGNDLMYRRENGDLVLYDIDSDSVTILLPNSSQILSQSSRVMELSSDGLAVILAHEVSPVYRYSFRALYTAVNIVSNVEIPIHPPNLAEDDDPLLQNFVWAPRGSAFAYVYLNNIYYQTSLTSTPVQITTNGQNNVIYNGIPDWVYEEEVFGNSNAIWFSSEGDKMAYATFDDTNVRVMRVPHYGVPGSVQYQYTLHHEIRYPKPGTTNPTVSVTLRDLESGLSTVYTAPTDIDQPILKTVCFVTNDSIAIMWTNRVQTMFRVVLCTLNQANCATIYQYTETNGWIDNIPLIFNEQGNSFITILPQTVDGVLYKQIIQVSDSNAQMWTNQGRTNTPHTVSEILRWTADDVIWYKATHVNDSAEQHVYRAAAGGVECFTCGVARADGAACLYNDAALSAAGDCLALNCAGPGVPQIFIYGSNGTRLGVWDDNRETSALVASKVLPETVRMSVPLGDGLPDADVMIQVPAGYQNRTDVPLLVYVYAGPDTALVTKQWSVDWGSSLVSRWGVAVAQIDGRGAGLRGAAGAFAVNRRLGTVEVDDQIAVTRHLQQTLGWVDAGRTCIWGWSYGGYAASLALARGGDVFRCAIAVAPVVDWRFYDTIYTERYMDVPSNNPIGYAQSSLLSEQVVEAYRNKSYCLVHGTADDNVHFQHAMLISRLLQRRDVYFTQMTYTDEDHGLIGVRPHLYHSLEKYLQKEMLE